jgi:CRP-like cAMP-binding protein
MATPEPRAGAVELLLALKAVAPFSTLPPDDLALLVERAERRRFGPGEPLHEAGEPIRGIHLVLDGRVTETRAGRPWAVREAYELVGGVDALAGTGDDVVVTAETATETLHLDRDAVIEICYDRFSVLATVTAGVGAMAIAARRRLGASAGYATAAIERPPLSVASRLGLAERMVALSAVPALAATRVHTLGYLAGESREITLDAGRAAWHAGDPADHLLVIVSGTVACAAADDAQHFVVGPGDVVGELDALASVPRWFTATASAPVRALRIRTADLLDVLEDDPETAVEGLSRFASLTVALVDRVARDAPSS